MACPKNSPNNIPATHAASAAGCHNLTDIFYALFPLISNQRLIRQPTELIRDQCRQTLTRK